MTSRSGGDMLTTVIYLIYKACSCFDVVITNLPGTFFRIYTELPLYLFHFIRSCYYNRSFCVCDVRSFFEKLEAIAFPHLMQFKFKFLFQYFRKLLKIFTFIKILPPFFCSTLSSTPNYPNYLSNHFSVL